MAACEGNSDSGDDGGDDGGVRNNRQMRADKRRPLAAELPWRSRSNRRRANAAEVTEADVVEGAKKGEETAAMRRRGEVIK